MPKHNIAKDVRRLQSTKGNLLNSFQNNTEIVIPQGSYLLHPSMLHRQAFL